MNNLDSIQEDFMARLKDVEMDVTVRFGLTEMPLQDVANLGSGSMIELNRTVDDPVEILVNDRPYARGEVVVVDGYYAVRITEVSPPEKHSNTFLVDSLTGMDTGDSDLDEADSPAPAPAPTAAAPQQPAKPAAAAQPQPEKPAAPPQTPKPTPDQKPNPAGQPQAKPAAPKPPDAKPPAQ